MLQEHFQTILDALLRACADFYRERLVSAAVFGSIARGTMRPDSDIDLLLVVAVLFFFWVGGYRFHRLFLLEPH